MFDIALLTLSSAGVLLVYIFIGYLLRRSGKFPDNAGKVLATLAMTLILPVYTARTLSKNFTVASIGSNLALLGCGILFTAVSIIVGIVLSKRMGKDDFDRKSLQYAFTFANYGYFGYPMLESVFGANALACGVVFALPFSISCNTSGYLMFSKEKKLTWKKVLLIPNVIGAACGITLGLTGITLPSFFTTMINAISGCLSPISMLLVGLTLGSFPLKKLFSGTRAYLLGLIRLLGIPFVFTIVLYVCGVRGLYLLLPALFSSLPLGSNLVIYPESYGIDASDNARTCFISYILAIVILPVSFAIISHLAGI